MGNIFSTFTFSSFIKTILPGFVWVVALWWGWALVYKVAIHLPPVASGMVGVPFPLARICEVEKAIAVAFLSMLLGLLSNILAFMGGIDKAVRNPVSKSKAKEPIIYNLLCADIKKTFLSKIDFGEKDRDLYIEIIDAEILLLPKIGESMLSYVRNQYWYYLEFQINVCMALSVLMLEALLLLLGKMAIFFVGDYPFGMFVQNCAVGPLALPDGAVLPNIEVNFFEAAAIFVGSLFLIIFLWKSAKKNYVRHLGKMASLMAAVAHAEASQNVQKPRERTYAFPYGPRRHAR